MEKVEGVSLLNAPPLSVLLDQQLIENEKKSADGETIKTSFIEQQLFAIGCSATADGLTLYPIDISVRLDSPIGGKLSNSLTTFFLLTLVFQGLNSFSTATKAPQRLSSKIVKLGRPPSDDVVMKEMEPKTSVNGNSVPGSPPNLRELSEEVEHLAFLLSEAID